jgi:predicted negative regulator of RcsB-dependent stress response
MAVYDLEEQERIDALKDWWDKNRTTVITVFAVVVLATAAYYGWKYYANQQNVQAEALHKEFVKVVAERDAKKISDAAGALIAKFPSSFFATDAAFSAAKASFDAKDFEGARKNLQWVVDKGKSELRAIARIRLATVLLEEKKYDEALKVVDAVTEEAYVALASDLKGDILTGKGSKEEARLAYQLALDKADSRSALRQSVQVKIDAVGGASVTGPAPAPTTPSVPATTPPAGAAK